MKIGQQMIKFQQQNCTNELINFQVILTDYLEKNCQILIGIEMDRRCRGYTFSGDSGMENIAF